ncbi:hypothetical protein D9M73_220450 [compost metagenome]
MYRTSIFRATLKHHLHHLRDHITGTTDDHRVANAQAQAGDFVHVVLGGVGHGHTSHLDRLQACHRRYRAGAADLELHVQQFGKLFHGRKLVGNCPTRLTGTKAQLALSGQAVGLEHHAIDFVRQAVAPLADVAVVGQALFDARSVL